MGPTSSSNQFFGVKISQVGVPVNQAADSQLVYKSNFSTNLFNGPSGVWKVMEGTRQPTIGNGLTAPQQGFWVAEDGVDVQQATDVQMVFNSSNAIFAASYTITPADLSNAFASFTINHGLGFQPSVSGSVSFGALGFSLPLPAIITQAVPSSFAEMNVVVSVGLVTDAIIVINVAMLTDDGITLLTAEPTLSVRLLCSPLTAVS